MAQEPTTPAATPEQSQSISYPSVSSFPLPDAGSKADAALGTVQRQSGPSANGGGSNSGNLPTQLRSGVEALSGHSMSDVKVHYNSPKPANLGALAYAQGNQIHLGPGQQKHLPHEAWHVAQQKQGRVKPTMQMKSGHAINDSQQLEREADHMGAAALRAGSNAPTTELKENSSKPTVVQRKIGAEIEVLRGQLRYEDKNNETDGKQGTVVGSITAGGGQSEIHLEGPGNQGAGIATLEFATGVFDQDQKASAEHPSKLAKHVGALGRAIADKKGTNLKLSALPGVTLSGPGARVNAGEGPDLQLASNPGGSIQINISPKKKTAIKLYNFTDGHYNVESTPEATKVIPKASELLPDDHTKGFAQGLYQRTVANFEEAIGNPAPMPSFLRLAIRALMGVPRVLYHHMLMESSEFLSGTSEKNIFELMPRSSLLSLWYQATSDKTVYQWICKGAKMPGKPVELTLERALVQALNSIQFPVRATREVLATSPEASAGEQKMELFDGSFIPDVGAPPSLSRASSNTDSLPSLAGSVEDDLKLDLSSTTGHWATPPATIAALPHLSRKSSVESEESEADTAGIEKEKKTKHSASAVALDDFAALSKRLAALTADKEPSSPSTPVSTASSDDFESRLAALMSSSAPKASRKSSKASTPRIPDDDPDLLAAIAAAERMGRAREAARKVRVPDPVREQRLRGDIMSTLGGIISGQIELVQPRFPKSHQQGKGAVLENTTTSMVPIDEENGLAGVYELRNPFSSDLPPEHWQTAMAHYEKLLMEAGVRY